MTSQRILPLKPTARPCTEEVEPHEHTWDKWAIGISILCLLHCIATPLLIFIYPLISQTTHSNFVHVIFFGILILVGSFAFYKGFIHHRKVNVLIISFSGFALLISSLIITNTHGAHFHSTPDNLLTMIGSGILIWAHILILDFATDTSPSPSK